MKILYCCDIGFHCNAVIRESTYEEVLQHATEHARIVHHTTFTPEITEQIKSLIKEEEKPKETYYSPESC